MPHEYSKLTKRNSKAFFDVYMARKDDVLNAFFNKIESQGGPKREELDFSPESLIPLWTWLRKQVKLPDNDEHPPEEERPIWYDYTAINGRYGQFNIDKETAHWLDGLAYYFGEVLIKYLGLHWCLETDSRTEYYNKPVLDGGTYFYPLNNLRNMIGMEIKKTPKCHGDSKLSDLFFYLKKEVEHGGVLGHLDVD